MAGQAEHFETMKDSMPLEARLFYADYFDNYSKYFSSVSRPSKLEKLQDPRIYQAFEGALLDKYPSAIYKCVLFSFALKLGPRLFLGEMDTCSGLEEKGRFLRVPRVRGKREVPSYSQGPKRN